MEDDPKIIIRSSVKIILTWEGFANCISPVRLTSNVVLSA